MNLFLSIIIIFFPLLSSGAVWEEVRSQDHSGRWSAVVCDNGNGWRSCEMPYSLSLTASLYNIVAGGNISTITLSVKDYFGEPVANELVQWQTTEGELSQLISTTNDSGFTSIEVISSKFIGPVTISATVAINTTAKITINFIDNWVPESPSYTAWVNHGSPYNCTNWTPSVSTKPKGQSFTQTASDCKQDQVRYRQNREVSTVTGNVRNVGQSIQETRTLSGAVSSRSAIGTLAPSTCYGYKTLVSGSATFVSLSKGSVNSAFLWNAQGRIDIAPGVLSINHGGYRLFPGKFLFENGTSRFYETCREPL